MGTKFVRIRGTYAYGVLAILMMFSQFGFEAATVQPTYLKSSTTRTGDSKVSSILFVPNAIISDDCNQFIAPALKPMKKNLVIR